MNLKECLFRLSSGNFEERVKVHIYYLEHTYDLFYIDSLEFFIFDRNFEDKYKYENIFAKEDFFNASVLSIQAIRKNEFEIHIFY